MFNFNRVICTFFIGISGVVVGESEEWRNEHTLGTVAIRATFKNGQKRYFNTAGDHGSPVRTFWDSCHDLEKKLKIKSLLFKNKRIE